MLHDIASLKLQGANFDELELSLFYFKDKARSKSSCCKGVRVCQEFCVNRFNKQHRIAA